MPLALLVVTDPTQEEGSITQTLTGGNQTLLAGAATQSADDAHVS